MTKSNGSTDKPIEQVHAITTLSVAAFKSIFDEQTIEIRPLTLLAGANSSGKSSMLQPLLLLKQTLEAQYDPGPLRLDGPNVKFTSVSQFWPSRFSQSQPNNFVVTIGASNWVKYGVAFSAGKKLRVDYNFYNAADRSVKIAPDSPARQIIKLTFRTSALDYPGISPGGKSFRRRGYRE